MTHKRYRRRAGLLVSALALVAACGSAGHTAATGHPAPPKHASSGSIASGFTGHGPRVVILGDSLTVEGWDALYDGLDGHYSVEIGAWFGEGYDGGPFSTALHLRKPLLVSSARTFGRSHPAVAVLAVGTNDAWTRHRIARALAGMRAMLGALRPACLVGVTLPSHSAASGWSQTVADRLNAATRAWADQLVDWASLSQTPGVLVHDGIHTTPAGTTLRANAIVKAVEACKRSSGSS